MNRSNLIIHCLYYKGEKENPYQGGDKAQFWEYEKIWVNEMSKDEGSNLLTGNTADYIHAGLLSWNETDGTPYLLKALLFNRYCHWIQGSVESFKDWYSCQYINN